MNYPRVITQNEMEELTYALDDLEGGADFQDAIASKSIHRVVDFMRNVLSEDRL